MIAYDIQCANGHTFEGWFADASSFEDQKERGLIECPSCAVTSVERIPSSFAIGKSRERDTAEREARPAGQAPVGLAMLSELQKHIEKHFEDVGASFAEEAVKIHYGEQDQKNIRGTTTDEEEKMLKEEGVPFMKIPIIRYDS
jgi:hypothetical protein